MYVQLSTFNFILAPKMTNPYKVQGLLRGTMGKEEPQAWAA